MKELTTKQSLKIKTAAKRLFAACDDKPERYCSILLRIIMVTLISQYGQEEAIGRLSMAVNEYVAHLKKHGMI